MTYRMGVILFAGLAISGGFAAQMLMEESSRALSNRSAQSKASDQPLEGTSLVECLNGIARVNIYARTHIENAPMTFNGQMVECEATGGQVDAYLVDGHELSAQEFGAALTETMKPSMGEHAPDDNDSPGFPTIDEAALRESIEDAE